MKVLKKISVLLLSICMLSMAFSSEIFAASSSVKVSSASGNVGSKVTITCTATVSGSDIGSADISLSYDPSALKATSASSGANATGGGVFYSGYADNAGSKSLKFTVTFEICKAGSHRVTVESADIGAWDDSVSVSTPSKTNGTVTGKTPTPTQPNNGSTNNNTTQNNKDSNNKLSGLQVYPGTLSPAFSAGTSVYNVTVPGDTKEVTISATPQSTKAKVTVSGGKDLKLGVNTAQVVVVAESGASRAYNITIMCGEKEKIQIDGTDCTIEENFTDAQIPSGFTRTKLTYKDRQYEGLANASGTLHLIHLQGGSGTAFYIYDEAKQEFYNFVQIAIAEGKYIIPLPLEEVEAFADAEAIELDVQQKKVNAWKLNEEFSVVNALNQNGEKVLYQYDSVDGTFQRYANIQPEGTEQTSKEPVGVANKYYLYAIIGLGSLVLILSVALIYFVASRKKRHEGRKRKALKRLEKQKEKEIVIQTETEEEPKKRSKAWIWILIGLLTVAVLGAAAYGVNWYLETQKANEEREVKEEEKEELEEYVGKSVTEFMDKVAETGYKAVYFQGEENFTERIDMIKEDYLVSEVRVSDVEKRVKVAIEKEELADIGTGEEVD